MSPIKTSLIEHLKKEKEEEEAAVEARSGPTEGCTCVASVFTNSPELSGWDPAPHRIKELIIKVTNDYTAFIAFSGIICMNFTSLVNNPFTVINKAETG